MSNRVQSFGDREFTALMGRSVSSIRNHTFGRSGCGGSSPNTQAPVVLEEAVASMPGRLRLAWNFQVGESSRPHSGHAVRRRRFLWELIDDNLDLLLQIGETLLSISGFHDSIMI